MAIAYDSTANGTASSASSLTYAFNNVAGNVATVGVSINDQNQTTSTVTYATVGMTRGAVKSDAIASNESSVWYLGSPATGSNNVVVTPDATLNINSGAISLSGADSASPLGSTATGAGVGLSTSLVITTANANSIVVDVVGVGGNPGGITVSGTGQTERWDNATSREAGGSTQTTTTAGNYTSIWDGLAGSAWSAASIEIKEGSAAGATKRSNNLLTLGVS